MKEAIKKIRDTDKLEILSIDNVPYLEVTLETHDSSYGYSEDSVFIPIKICPFCGTPLTSDV